MTDSGQEVALATRIPMTYGPGAGWIRFPVTVAAPYTTSMPRKLLPVMMLSAMVMSELSITEMPMSPPTMPSPRMVTPVVPRMLMTAPPATPPT